MCEYIHLKKVPFDVELSNPDIYIMEFNKTPVIEKYIK